MSVRAFSTTWESLRQKRSVLFQYFDIVAIIGTFASVMGVMIPIFTENIDAKVKWSVVSLTAMAISATWFVARLSKLYGHALSDGNRKDHEIEHAKRDIEVSSTKLKNVVRDRNDVAHRLHNVLHEARTVQSDMLAVLTRQEAPTKEQINLLLKEFIIHFLDNTRNIFQLITEKQCAVTIKAADINDTVYTYARDSISLRERSEIDGRKPFYHSKENTAFFRILSPDYEDKIFVSDDLHIEAGYVNSNPHWHDFYTACLVVPIRCRKSSSVKGIENYDVWGFVCVDNKDGGFQNRIAIETLCGLADSLYCLFNAYALSMVSFRQIEGGK